MLIENIDKGDVKCRNKATFYKQAQFFQTWCSQLGIKDVTLTSLPQIHRERIMLAYALDVSKGNNLKNMDSISVKTVKNYLRAAASHAVDNGMRDPRIRYSPEGLPIDNGDPFPAMKKLFAHMTK